MSNILQMNTSFYCQHIFKNRILCSNLKQPSLPDLSSYFFPLVCSTSLLLVFMVFLDLGTFITQDFYTNFSFCLCYVLAPNPQVSPIFTPSLFSGFCSSVTFPVRYLTTLYNRVTHALPYPQNPPWQGGFLA